MARAEHAAAHQEPRRAQGLAPQALRGAAISAWAGRRSTAARARARWSRPSSADEMARADAPAPTNGLGIGHRRPDDHRSRHRRPEAALPPEDPHRRGDVVPALLRAERGLRPGRAAHRGGGQAATTSSSTARRSGRAAAPSPTGGCCWRAPIPTAAKHQGISCFLMNMRQPGVEVRPLKQITGCSEFCEVFMTNARVREGEPDRATERGLGHRADHARLRARRPRARPHHHVCERSTTS